MTSFQDMVLAYTSEETPYLHVVGFKFPESVDAAAQADLMVDCQALYSQCGGLEAGIWRYQVVRNVDARKGYTWAEFALFRDREAFLHFHAHPAHQTFAARIALLADVWVVLDTDQLSDWFV